MPAITESKYMVQAGWQDVPHLDDSAKRELMSSIPPYLREARMQGIPALGLGAIYPIPLEEVTCDPFAIQVFGKRGYGMDVGWARTAASWLRADATEGSVGGSYACG